MTSAEREFDIVLYGATGFSGKLAAHYLARAGKDARIALAGRSRERLLALRDALGPTAQNWPVVIADVSEQSTLDAMAARTRVVANAVGPYTRHGLPVVAACAQSGTDYADLTAETMFVRASIDRYHQQAVDNGARIVPSCAFASIPSDLNVYQLYRRVTEDGAGELADTTLVLRSFLQVGSSIGTAASIIEMMHAASTDPASRRLVDDPYTLTTERGAEPELGPQPDFRWRRGHEVAPELAGFWTAGFMWGPSNSRIIRRSNALQDWNYGRQFRYSETMSLGRSFAAPVAAAAVTAAMAALWGVGNRYLRRLPRRLLDRITAGPGSGPNEWMRRRGHYTIETYTATTTGRRYLATFGQRCDGYNGTAVMFGESCLALALDRDRLSPLHGVLTPAAALGDALLTRLPVAGVSMGTTRLN